MIRLRQGLDVSEHPPVNAMHDSLLSGERVEAKSMVEGRDVIIEVRIMNGQGEPQSKECCLQARRESGRTEDAL